MRIFVIQIGTIRGQSDTVACFGEGLQVEFSVGVHGGDKALVQAHHFTSGGGAVCCQGHCNTEFICAQHCCDVFALNYKRRTGPANCYPVVGRAVCAFSGLIGIENVIRDLNLQRSRRLRSVRQLYRQADGIISTVTEHIGRLHTICRDPISEIPQICCTFGKLFHAKLAKRGIERSYGGAFLGCTDLEASGKTGFICGGQRFRRTS